MIATAAIDIDAPIDVVWSVILDLKSYPEWNPFIFHVTHLPDSLVIGSRFLLHVRWANGTTATSWETATQIIPPSIKNDEHTAMLTYRYSSWLAQSGLVRATREQYLSQLDGQLTSYRTQETFHGILRAFLSLSAVQDGFQRHADALKQRAEWVAKNKSQEI
jgi:hypothetical protein